MKQLIVDRHTTPGTPTLEEVPTEKVPVYDSVSDAEADFANLEVGQILATKEPEKSLLDFLYPIGVTYVQYPQQKSPNELWPNMTWTKLDYAGAFFRADGGLANGYATCSDTLACCKQDGTAPNACFNHRHLVYVRTKNEACASGAAYITACAGSTANSGSAGGSAWSSTCNLSLAASNSKYGKRDEFAPENYTIQIWVRTA